MLIRKFYVLEALPADLAMAICLREIVLCSAAIVSLNAKTTKKQQRMAHYSSELRLLKRLNKKGLV